MDLSTKDEIFQLYKPLRNHIQKVGLRESLGVIWGYMQNLQFNTPFPKDVEVLRSYQHYDYLQKHIMIPEFELESLTREIIINAPPDGDESFRNWNYFAAAINKLKRFENEISRICVSPINIYSELIRCAHRQFKWQKAKRDNKNAFIRYFKIFGHPEVAKIIEHVLGCTPLQAYRGGSFLFSLYLDYPAVAGPIKIKPSLSKMGINQTTIKTLVDLFSLDFEVLKDMLKKRQKLNDTYAYSYNDLYNKPIIRLDVQGKLQFVCPIPTLLFWRMTSGIFYDICDEKGFGNAFGPAFQKYVGDVAMKCNTHDALTILAEREYKKSSRERVDSIDWIISNNKDSLFIECKTKRMTVAAKAELFSAVNLRENLEHLSDGIVQIYKNLTDCRAGTYPYYRIRDGETVYPLLVTLEDWHIFGPKIIREIKSLVKKRMVLNELDVSLLKSIPFSICSVSEFEDLIQVIHEAGIHSVMQKKLHHKDRSEWEFETFLATEFPGIMKKVKFPFSEEIDRILPNH